MKTSLPRTEVIMSTLVSTQANIQYIKTDSLYEVADAGVLQIYRNFAALH